jgi:hypothetical protein
VRAVAIMALELHMPLKNSFPPCAADPVQPTA